MDRLNSASTLVRGRSSVRSRPAAPISQALSLAFGRDKDSAAPAEHPAARLEPCKIRGASPARDVLDVAAGAEHLALTLKWAGKGLSDAWEHDIDAPRARLVALRTLQRAHVDLGTLIAGGPFTVVAFWRGAEPTVRFSLSPEAREALCELLNNPEAGEPEEAFVADEDEPIVLEWRFVKAAPAEPGDPAP